MCFNFVSIVQFVSISCLQVFIRRIIQATTELQDGRDIVLDICKCSLTQRQWRLLCDITGSSDNLNEQKGNEEEEDKFGLGLTGFDLDPSVRYLIMPNLCWLNFGEFIMESCAESIQCSIHMAQNFTGFSALTGSVFSVGVSPFQWTSKSSPSS